MLQEKMAMPDTEEISTRKLVEAQNRKSKKSGGFQSMGLSHLVYKGVMRKGYRVPTPIQRKAIPVIMHGGDVVAMARTGSGKTAAFLLPMLEKLQCHNTKGARGLILSPTRELALQTLKFAKEIGRFTSLKFTLILGGDRLEQQFSAMHENPDIVIATPGRLLHLIVEMDLKLSHIDCVVFDEADRLFEMGFAEQLQEILSRLPDTRQTLLFSATLPKNLIEFTKAGLNDPTLIRLDVDSKLSQDLKILFFSVRDNDKTGLLLYLLRNRIKPTEQCVIFTATKHHVEYLKQILSELDIDCAYIYSSLDATARKINIVKFQKKLCQFLIVTDVAARGMDIPMLDAVINYDFPAKPKLFVHRVGRVARAGKSGVAYSLVTADEIPYLIDLYVFLGRTLKIANPNSQPGEDGLFGAVPQSHLDDQLDAIRELHSACYDVSAMKKVVCNALKQYVKTRPLPSPESVKRAKELSTIALRNHPFFIVAEEEKSVENNNLLESLRNFKPSQTIFEVRNNKKSAGSASVMKEKRELHLEVIQRNSLKREQIKQQFSKEFKNNKKDCDETPDSEKSKLTDDYYIPNRSINSHQEAGLSVTTYEKEAKNASIDLVADSDIAMQKQSSAKKWDRKRKKYVGATDDAKSKKIKTESGQWIPASYKTNIYKEWLGKNRFNNSRELDDTQDKYFATEEKDGNTKKGKFSKNRPGKDNKSNRAHSELKTKDEILKTRLKKDKIQARLKFKQSQKNSRPKKK